MQTSIFLCTGKFKILTNIEPPLLPFIEAYHYLIIGWEVRVSRMGPLRSGPRGRTDGVGEYKTPGMRDSICTQRGRARSALFYRVILNSPPLIKKHRPKVCQNTSRCVYKNSSWLGGLCVSNKTPNTMGKWRQSCSTSRVDVM